MNQTSLELVVLSALLSGAPVVVPLEVLCCDPGNFLHIHAEWKWRGWVRGDQFFAHSMPTPSGGCVTLVSLAN